MSDVLRAIVELQQKKAKMQSQYDKQELALRALDGQLWGHWPILRKMQRIHWKIRDIDDQVHRWKNPHIYGPMIKTGN